MDLFKYVISPVVLFAGGYLLLRIAGKKAVSQMNSFDLLVVLVLGTVLSQPMASDRTFETLYFALAFVLLYVVFSMMTLNNKMRWLLVETSTVLIRDGDIDEKGLKKVRMTTEELVEELRLKGFSDPKEVEMATMESSGKLSVIPKSAYRPVHPKDLHLHPPSQFIPIPLIMDGQVIDHNLKYLEKDRSWLYAQLANQSLSESGIQRITLASYDEYGNVTIDPADSDLPKDPLHYKPGRSN